MTTDRITVDFMRRDEAALRNAIRAAGVTTWKGRACCCPFHEDRHPSAGIFEKEGIWHFRCHVCDWTGDVFDVAARFRGIPVADVLREHNGANGHAKGNGEKKPVIYPTIEAIEATFSRREATYRYVNPETKLPDLVVIRYLGIEGEKHFTQIRPVEGGFEQKAPAGKLPIWNRSRLLTCDDPVVVEGEKCVEELARHKIVSTTSPGGAKNAHKADWSPLNGKSRVTIWRDNDVPGQDYQAAVIAEIEQLPQPPAIYIVDPAAFDLGDGEDCVEFVEKWSEGEGDIEGQTRALRAAIDSAQPAGAAKELKTLYDDTIAGRRRAIEFPWKLTSRVTQALLPGTATAICADPESGKSLMILEALWYWQRQGLKPALFALEDDRSFHMMRAHAQIAGESRLTDAKWVEENAAETNRLFELHKDELNRIGCAITTAPNNVVRLPELNEWVERMAAAGHEIIIIDPITAAENGARPWIEDKEFLIKAKSTVRQYGARLILVTHPRIGVNMKPGLSSMSGGAAYPRFCHSVAWLVKHDKKTVKVSTDHGPLHIGANRTLRIVKARNARGGGYDVALCFDFQTLRFAEQGIIEKDEHGTD